MAASEKRISTSLNTKTIGSGFETIVLAHGYGSDQSIWDLILPSLAEKYLVVLFDWPFSGAVKDHSLYDPVKYSSYEAFADDLITLMDEMNLKATTFVGHSMSGMIGCIASTKRPDLFKRLVLVGASPRYLNTDDYEGGFKSSDVEQLLSSIESDYESWTSAFASMLLGPNNTLFVEIYHNCLKTMRPQVAKSLAKTVFETDYRELLARVETPTTIIQTTNDAAIPHSVALYMEGKIRGNCTLKIIDTEGHFPHLTTPLEVVEVIKDALGLGLAQT